MDFVKKHIAGVKSLYVTWFGGEPLIGMPVIEELSRQLIELCEEKEITYSAGIVTNGYLLTKENAERLKECQVGRVQITIDGPKEIHDVRRPLVNGNGTYDIIMKNIMDVKEVLPISLRINVDYDNIAEANKVMNFLREKDMLKYVSPYLEMCIRDRSICMRKPEKFSNIWNQRQKKRVYTCISMARTSK